MRLIPLAKRRGVDGDDGVLDEGLRPHQFVVAGVVDGVDDTRLASDRLGSPREVAGVQSALKFESAYKPPSLLARILHVNTIIQRSISIFWNPSRRPRHGPALTTSFYVVFGPI